MYIVAKSIKLASSKVNLFLDRTVYANNNMTKMIINSGLVISGNDTVFGSNIIHKKHSAIIDGNKISVRPKRILISSSQPMVAKTYVSKTKGQFP